MKKCELRALLNDAPDDADVFVGFELFKAYVNSEVEEAGGGAYFVEFDDLAAEIRRLAEKRLAEKHGKAWETGAAWPPEQHEIYSQIAEQTRVVYIVGRDASADVKQGAARSVG